MTLDQVIDHFGSVAEVASKLGISVQAVYQWEDGVPNGRQWQIQALTKGKLRVEPKKRKNAAA